MKKVLFIDRDGTLIKEPADEQVDAFEKLIFYPKVFQYLGKICKTEFKVETNSKQNRKVYIYDLTSHIVRPS